MLLTVVKLVIHELSLGHTGGLEESRRSCRDDGVEATDKLLDGSPLNYAFGQI